MIAFFSAFPSPSSWSDPKLSFCFSKTLDFSSLVLALTFLGLHKFQLPLPNGSSHWGLSLGYWDFYRSPWPWLLDASAPTPPPWENSCDEVSALPFQIEMVKVCDTRYIYTSSDPPVGTSVRSEKCRDFFGAKTPGSALVEIEKIFDEIKNGISWVSILIFDLHVTQPFLNQNSSLYQNLTLHFTSFSNITRNI